MSFTAQYPGECGQCGEELQDQECTYAQDKTIVHLTCLIAYNTGVTPGPPVGRNERKCGNCFQIHAGDCP